MGLALGYSGPAASEGFGVRARPGGLDWIADTALNLLPASIPVPDIDRELAECFGDRVITAHVTEGATQLDWRDLSLTPGNGTLRVATSLDLSASARVRVDYAYACLGYVVCNVNVEAKPIDVAMTLGMSTGADGEIRVDSTAVNLVLDPDAISIDLSDCAIDDAVEWVYDATESWLLDFLSAKVEEVAATQVAELIRAQLANLTQLDLETNGFAVHGWLESLHLGASTGVTLTGDATVQWTGPVHPDFLDQGSPATEPPSGEPLPAAFGPGDFSLAASDQLVTRALFQAWRAGLFRALLADMAPSIELSQDGLAQKLGLPAGTVLDVSIDVGSPPYVAFGRDATGDGVEIALDNLLVEVRVDSPGASSSTITAELDATLLADVAIESGIGALVVNPTDLVIDRLSLTAGETTLQVDPERLAEFIRAVGVPMLGDKLSGMPIAPALSPMDGVFMLVRQLATDGGWLRVGFDLITADPNDHVAPNTRLLDAPALVGPGMVGLAVDGTDDTTPPELLRFSATLDGTPLTAEPSFLHVIRLSAADGDHVLEVTAMDLNGNVDPTPERHSFTVDGVPPELTITEAPGKVVDSDGAKVAWTASDDRGLVETSWELRRLDRDSERGVVVAGEGFAAGRTGMTLENLDSDRLYVLTIIARDQAGNVTSREIGFAFEAGGGGCSVAGGGSPSLWLLVLAALALVARRRRARGLAAAAAVALAIAAPGAASAQGIGTTLSGPTDADGASAFWNPAAMALGYGTRIDIGSGLSLIRASYTPEDAAAGSKTFVPKPEPTVGAYTALGPRWRLGFTVGVPQIDGARWSRDDAASDVTRYYAAQARNFYVTATTAASFTVNERFSLGAGVSFVHSRLTADLDKDMGKQLNLSLGSPSPDAPFPYANASLAAPVDLQAAGWGVSFVGGVLVRPVDRVTVGAGIHSQATTHATGTVEATYPDSMVAFVEEAAPGAELPELSGDIDSDLVLPMMVFAAVAVEPADAWELRVDYRYLDRSSASTIDLVVVESTSPDVSDTAIVRGYRDRHSVGLRGTYSFLEGRGTAALRTRYENNGVPETTASPSNIDFAKYELGAAVQWSFSETVSGIAAYSHYFIPPREVDDSLHQPLAEPSLDAFNHPSPTGTYEATSDYLTLSLSVLL